MSRSRSCRKQSTGTPVPQGQAGRGHRWHGVISLDDASDGGTCEFSTSSASVSQHPRGFWCWAQITEEGVHGEKSLEP